MNANGKSMKDFFLNGLQRRCRIIIGILLSVALILPIIFFIGTMMETMSYGRTVLGEDRYNARISDSCLYTAVIFGCATLIVTPGIIFVKKVANNYVKVVNTLSESAMEKLLKVNNKAPFYEKFMPPYIVKEDTVCFFNRLRQTTISFKDILAVHVKQSYYKGYNASVSIQTIDKKYHFRLSGDVFKVINLIDEAMQNNPQITVNKDWNVA